MTLEQTPSDLRHTGVTGCVVWSGAVVLAAALEQWCERGDFTVEGLQVHEEENMYKPILLIHHGDFIISNL